MAGRRPGGGRAEAGRWPGGGRNCGKLVRADMAAGSGDSETGDMTTIDVPDTALTREATELIRDTASELVYHHSRRVYLFGARQGRNRDLSFDPELLYVGAMFHDLGLGERFRTSTRRFEVDGADEARRFLQARGVP